jgi:hypothetical protein
MPSGETFTKSKNFSIGIIASFTGPTTILAGGSGTYIGTADCGTPPFTYRWWLREEGTGVGATVVGYGTPLTLTSVSRSSKSSASAEVTSSSDPIIMQPVQRTYYDLSLTVIDAIGNYTTGEQQITAYGDVDLISLTQDKAAQILQTNGIALYAYPNPSTNETTLSVTSSSDINMDINTEWDLEIYDQSQQLKMKKPS